MSKAAAKRIEAGEYEYRGYQIIREWTGEWFVYQDRNSFDGVVVREAVDARSTLAECKRAVDKWNHNN